MENVGLGLSALDRSAKTLSGGESQRIRLAAQLGSNLRGVLYVLDEPTIGLHPRDNDALLDTLEALQSQGNTLVIVEHDEETMRRFGHYRRSRPRRGMHGGEVVSIGTLAEIKKNKISKTGRYLRKPMQHPLRGSRRSLDKVMKWLQIVKADTNNLKDVTVKFPVGRLTAITGISGSGKKHPDALGSAPGSRGSASAKK